MIWARILNDTLQQQDGNHRLRVWFPYGTTERPSIFIRAAIWNYGGFNPYIPILDYGVEDYNHLYIVVPGKNPPGVYNLEIWQYGEHEFAINKLTISSDGYNYLPRVMHQRQVGMRGETMPTAKIAFDYDSAALPNVKQFDVYEVDALTRTRQGTKVGTTTTVPTDLTPLTINVSKFGSVTVEVVPIDTGNNEGFTDFLTLLVRLPKPTRIRAIG